MLKLRRYFKPYIALILGGILMLFCQVILELNLPNMMSRIVNVGIQKSGIEEVAPTALSPDAFALLTYFMPEADAEAAQTMYTPYDELDASQQASIDKTFPDAAAQNAMVLTATGDAADEADVIFGRAGYAFVQLVQQKLAGQGESFGDSGEVQADFDVEMLSQIAPLLQSATPDEVADVIDQASQAPATLTDSVSAVLNKGFYQSLGADTDSMQTGYIIRTGALMLLLSLLTVGSAVFAGYCFARMGAGIARDLRGDIYAKVTGFTNAEMDNFSTSTLINRTTNDITQVQMFYTMGMRMLIFSPIMGIGAVIMSLNKSVGMSWVIALAVLLILCVIGVLYAVVMPRFKKMQKLIDRLNLVARENLTGIMVIRAFGTQDFQQKRFKKANRDLTDNSLFVGRAMVTMMPIMMLIMNGLTLMIIWIGAEQIAASAMEVGDMMAFIQYAMHIVMSFLFIAMIFVMVPRASVSAERINEVLTSKSIINDPASPKTLGGKARGEIGFHNVSFKYAGAGENVLHDVSFTAKPGQTTAFIGATGAGKTTLVNLIPRFYDVSGGSVTLDGVDVRQLTQHELRDNIGYVPQKGLLFSGDIESNLRYGDENADEQTLERAAEVAQATEFISKLDEGLHSEISQGGTNVSGGQRQRLSIARALVKRAPVYIFDDSFSALDFATDAKLRAALKPYTENATVLIVAQRVSTIMNAEQIVVMDEGCVVGIGTHRDLLASCPAYREIAESQLSKEELA